MQEKDLLQHSGAEKSYNEKRKKWKKIPIPVDSN